MNAVRVHEFGEPEVLKYEAVEDLKPGDGQVVIRIMAAGVNPVEAYMRSGGYARKPNLPYTPGADGAGIIESVGSGVTAFKTGDRVYAYGSLSGTYAEFTLCNESQVHHLPAKTTFQQGAAIGIPYGTAFRSLFQKAFTLPGETVLIHGGTGGVGIAALQMAVAAGCTVFATGGSEEGRRLLINQGASQVFNHHTPDYLSLVKDLTGGRGIDVILEMLANKNLSADLSILAPGGRVIVIGSRGPIEINPRDLMVREALISGVLLSNATVTEIKSIHAAIGSGLNNGTLNPIIGHEMPLREANQAHRLIMGPGTGAYGKIVLVT